MIDEMLEEELVEPGVVEKLDLIALIDADTIAYIACLGAEEVNIMLPRSFYTDEEWEEITSNPTYTEGCEEYFTSDKDNVLSRCEDKINTILANTGCNGVELHFSSGRENFRYDLYEDYKANRTQRPPVGLKQAKLLLADKYENSEIHTKWEADDMVVCKKRLEPEKYLLCAIDKDVVYALPGRHYNYFEADYYRGATHVYVEMQFVDVSEKLARYWPYLQIINGDTSDNIIGPNRIGPQTMIPYFGGAKPKPAVKKLQDAIDHLPDDMTNSELWASCVDAYNTKGLSEFDALLNMNLVNMNMLTTLGDIPEGHKELIATERYHVIDWRPNE